MRVAMGTLSGGQLRVLPSDGMGISCPASEPARPSAQRKVGRLGQGMSRRISPSTTKLPRKFTKTVSAAPELFLDCLPASCAEFGPEVPVVTYLASSSESGFFWAPPVLAHPLRSNVEASVRLATTAVSLGLDAAGFSKHWPCVGFMAT